MTLGGIALLLAPFAYAEEPAPIAPPEGVVIGFSSHLHVRSDLLMTGLNATEGVTFQVPRAVALESDPILTLDFEHSDQLDPDRSTLTIRVGDLVVATARLDATNATGGRIQVPLPRDVLGAFNRLVIDATMRSTSNCEDPADPALWTRLRARSSILMPWMPEEAKADLTDWPWPLLDDHGYGPMEVAPLDLGSVTAADLQHAVWLGFAFGRHASYRHLVVHPPVAAVEDATVPVIAFGAGTRHALFAEALAAIDHLPGSGVVRVDAAPPLVRLAGGDPASVASAVRAMASRHVGRLGAGDSASVRDYPSVEPPPAKFDPLPVPTDDRFTLADLGIRSQTVRGIYPPPVAVPLRMYANARPKVGTWIDVDYAYGAGLDPSGSALEVRLNGRTIRTVPLDAPGGEQGASVRVEVPEGSMDPDSRLEFAFHFALQGREICTPVSDATLWGSILETTTLTIPRDFVADLPDLALLHNGMWPFGEAAGTRGVEIVVDAAPDGHDLASAMMLGGILGRVSHGSGLNLTVLSADQVPESTPNRLRILMSNGGPHPLLERLLSTGALTLFAAPGKPGAPPVGNPRHTSWIEEFFPSATATEPWLALHGTDPDGLRDLLLRLDRANEQVGLTGNAAILTSDGDLEGVSLVERRTIGALSWDSRLRYALRNSIGAILVAMVLTSAVIAGWFTRWVRRHGGST